MTPDRGIPTHDLPTDETVSRLRLHEGRAELLEEIMNTPVADRPAARPARHRTWTWAAPIAAAATVAALATAPLWWPGGDEAGGGGGVAGTPTEAAPATTGRYPVLTAAGWMLEDATEEDYGGGPEGEVEYNAGRDELTVTWEPEAGYADEVAEHRDETDPPTDGVPVSVDGVPALVWSAAPDDHVAIREAVDGSFAQVRGTGMTAEEFVGLLGAARFVGLEEFEAALPDPFVTSGERVQVVADMLADIETTSGASMPAGAEAPTTTELERYDIGADVAGGYACAWIAAYVDGDAATKDEAVRVLATARQWPVLLEMRDEGGYAQVLWQVAGKVSRGTVPPEWRQGIGC